MGAQMLVVNDLVAGYQNQAVAVINALSLEPGQAALLLGPSGAGKTTILLTLAGLLPRLSGDVRIDGQDPYAQTPRDRDRFRGTHIGFMFQELNLVRGLNVLDNLLLVPFACRKPQDKNRALALLERLEIRELAQVPVGKISRGQAQRVALARAVMISPKLLIVDEPTASLDDNSTDIVIALLLEMATETGAALLVATHDGRVKARIENQIVLAPKYLTQAVS